MISSPGARPAGRVRLTLRAGTILAAVMIDVAIWIGAVLIGDVDLAYATAQSTAVVGPASVIAAVIVAGLISWGLLALLDRVTRHAPAIWTTIAVVFLIVSLASPLMTAQSRQSMTTLVCMHVVAAFVIMTGFLRSESWPVSRAVEGSSVGNRSNDTRSGPAHPRAPGRPPSETTS